MSACGQLPAGCIIAGETVFDGGFYLFNAAGVAVDSTAATLTYTWTRQGDSVAAISLTEASAGVSRGVGIMSEVNGVTATVSATLTGALTSGVYVVVLNDVQRRHGERIAGIPQIRRMRDRHGPLLTLGDCPFSPSVANLEYCPSHERRTSPASHGAP